MKLLSILNNKDGYSITSRSPLTVPHLRMSRLLDFTLANARQFYSLTGSALGLTECNPFTPQIP